VIYFIDSWADGVQFESKRYTQTIAIANIIWITFLTFLFAFSRIRKPSFIFNLTLHWLMFAWLAWYAFPYLGELP